MKKYLLIILLIVSVTPSIALASWWNPLSWKIFSFFNKKEQPKIEQVIEQKSSDEKIIELQKQFDNLKNDSNNNTSQVKVNDVVNIDSNNNGIPDWEDSLQKTITTQKEEKKFPVSTKIITSTDTNPISITEKTTPSVLTSTELSISDISIEAKSNSALVKWKTSIPSESKILIEGKSYLSERGVNTIHYTNVVNLEPNLPYSGTITAIANNAWKSLNFNFTTKPIPLNIIITKKTCSSESCTISWETNYDSSGIIKIYKTSSDKIIKSSDYTLSNENRLSFSVAPDTEYTFKISATSDNQSTEITDSLKSNQTPPRPTDICSNISGIQTFVPDGMTLYVDSGTCIIPTPCSGFSCITVSA